MDFAFAEGGGVERKKRFNIHFALCPYNTGFWRLYLGSLYV